MRIHETFDQFPDLKDTELSEFMIRIISKDIYDVAQKVINKARS